MAKLPGSQYLRRAASEQQRWIAELSQGRTIGKLAMARSARPVVAFWANVGCWQGAVWQHQGFSSAAPRLHVVVTAVRGAV